MKENLGHLMVDIEAMGNESCSVICSIGAVEFNIKTGEIGRKFYVKVSIQSCLDLGLKVNGETIEWWMNQSDEARKEVTTETLNIGDALYKFRLFLQDIGTENLCLWGNSVRFDMGLLEDAYKAKRQPIPWNFRNERDVITLVAFAPELKANAEKTGTKHQPIDDCLFQIKYCSAIWNKINL